MANYVVLFRYTQQGVTNFRESPERINRGKALAESMGIRMLGIWLTMGDYDFVGVYEAPDDETMAAFALALAEQGNVATHTMRAFSQDEFEQIVSRVSRQPTR